MTPHFFAALVLVGTSVLAAPFVVADGTLASPPAKAAQADVIFLGEQHDNPGHHRLQAAWVQSLQPRAVVFEMLTPAQAAQITDQNRADRSALQTALEWDQSGWPDFSMYYPIFAAAHGADIYGAGVPRAQVREVMGQTLSKAFGEDVERFGLADPLPPAQQAKREDMQRIAHCDALPADLLPTMVSVQRLRDAVLARAAKKALAQSGGPVVVITGNGHARNDWGAPQALARAGPEIAIFSLGQGEGDTDPDGVFDVTLHSPGVDRGNPCDAFN